MSCNYQNCNSCNCVKPNNCRMVIEKYHKILKQAECLFQESEELVEQNAIRSIISAIKAIEKSFKIAEEAVELEVKANCFLEKSGCDTYCNKNSERCECLLQKATEEFICEEKAVLRALELLEAALCALKESFEYRERGYKAYEKYVKCVHPKKSEPNSCNQCKSNYNCR